MLYLFKNGFWVMLGQGLNSVFSLVLLIAFANALPKETYGIYQYILSIGGTLNIFTLTGMNPAIARAVAMGNEGVFRPSVIYQLKRNSLMFLAFCGLGFYYYVRQDTVMSLSFFVLAFFVPATLAFNTYSAYLEGKRQFQKANILSILSTLTYSVGMLLILLSTDSVVWIVTIYAITTFVASFSFYLYVLYTYKPPTTQQTAETFTYGRELTYLRIIDPIIAQIDKIILGHFWGPAQLATYSLAMAIPNRAMLFIKSWVAIGFPKFSEKTPEKINQVFSRRILQGIGVGVVVATVYILLAPYLFKYVLPQYLEGVMYSQFLAIGLIFALPNRYVSLLLTSQGKSRLLFKRSVIISVINIMLYTGLGISNGLLGLVIANISSAVISLFLNISMWKYATKTSA